ncbi:MAG: efflux RND transporter periplasmic adaptor subunit [Acidobacteriota bacterium]
MIRPLLLQSSPWLLVIAVAACSAGGVKPAADASGPRPAVPPPAGTIHVADASREFIGVETVGGAVTGAPLVAPAHVEFREGAVSQVGVPLSGRVMKVHVRTGDQVKRGDPLVTLDCPDAATLRAAVDTAAANRGEARTNLERQVRMLQQGVGVERDKLAAETRLTELEAALASAQAHAAFIGPGTASAVVLRAPLAGTVITRKAAPGMEVAQGADPILEIGDSSALWVVADVFERDLGAIRSGTRATVELPGSAAPLAGHVSSIGTVIASGLRTAPVRIALDAGAAGLRSGMYGRAQIDVSRPDITLPTDAVLIRDGKESIVYIENAPGTFTRRAVVVAQHVDHGRVQIVSGITPGERVVVRGALLLDGAADQLL